MKFKYGEPTMIRKLKAAFFRWAVDYKGQKVLRKFKYRLKGYGRDGRPDFDGHKIP